MQEIQVDVDCTLSDNMNDSKTYHINYIASVGVSEKWVNYVALTGNDLFERYLVVCVAYKETW